MDEHGIFEHALFDVPRRSEGYCVDDVARALIVLVREPDRTPELDAHAETCLAFLEDAVDVDGRVHNRMAAGGGWTFRRPDCAWTDSAHSMKIARNRVTLYFMIRLALMCVRV